MSLTVVIPVFNSASTLGDTLASLPEGVHIIVVDGGSQDESLNIAKAYGVSVIKSELGRGLQLACGAEASHDSWLLFLHGDTRLDVGWFEVAQSHMKKPENTYVAAVFQFALRTSAFQARCLEFLVRWRTQALGLPYGDQGLLISRVFYESLGGYQPLPLMEDVALIRAIGRKRLVSFPVKAVTSAEKWEREGWLIRSCKNLLCLGLYFCGVSPHRIRQIYG